MAKRSPDMIVQLLHSKNIVTFEEIRNALGEASRATTFRHLKHVPYMRSYNYNGRYYTLRDPIRFDRWGLYSDGDICFSRDGKLDITAIRLVQESEAGMTQRELGNLLKVRVQVVLLDAIRRKRIQRERVEGVYLYLHGDPTARDVQLEHRCNRIASHRSLKGSVEVDTETVIEVLLVLVRHPGYGSSDVVRALRGHIPPITMEQVGEVFFRYDLDEIIKKKDSTVS